MLKESQMRRFFNGLRAHRKLFFCLVFALLAGMSFWNGIIQSVLMREIENTVLTWRFEQRGSIPPDERIAILGVDTSTFALYTTLDPAVYASDPVLQHVRPEWPWDKRVFAHVLDKLADAGAKLIIFDFVFFSESEGDAYFADALARHRDRVVLAAKYEIQENAQGHKSVVFYEPNDSIFPPPRSDDDFYEDIIGFANVSADSDRQVRRAYYQESSLRLNFLVNDRALPTDAASLDFDLISMTGLAAQKINPELSLPAREEPLLINYTGPSGTYRMIPVEEILLPDSFRVWENVFESGAVFKDKIVIVGPYAETQFKDIHPTPVGTMPGPEIQANLLVSLLHDNFIRPLNSVYAHLLTALFALVAWIVFIRYEHVLSKLIALVAIAVCFALASQWAFAHANLWVPVGGFLLCIVVGANFAILYDFLLEQYERIRIHGMFGTYVSPEVVNSMIASGKEPQLGGVDEHITCFFSDVQSFSGFSEVLTPVQLVDLMNEYLTGMTDILHEHGGTLDKYIGDAIVAMFGAPIRTPDHAYKACLTACRMHECLAGLRKKWQSEGDKWHPLCHHMQTRIGLNTGLAIVGNMGSATRFNYTFMGDNVNLAARCESGAKSYGVYTMVTESTWKEATAHGSDLVFRYLDKIVVKGRSQPVAMYELLCHQDALTDAHRRTLELWEQGIECYLKRDWSGAIQRFENALEYEPYHPARCHGSPTTPSHVMLERCRIYQKNPPPDAWDGVFVMTSK